MQRLFARSISLVVRKESFDGAADKVRYGHGQIRQVESEARRTGLPRFLGC